MRLPLATALLVTAAGCSSARTPAPVAVTCVTRVEPVVCPAPPPPATPPPPTAVTPPAPPARPTGIVVRWGASWQPASVLGTVCNGIQRVRFAGDPDDETELVSARDVQETDAQGRYPEVHTPPPGAPLPEGAFVPRGMALLARSSGVWYPARALHPSRAGAVRIHYDGYGSDDDEDLPRDALRRPDADPLTHPAGRPASTGEPVSQRDTLTVGTPVEARARGRWFDARVVSVECEGVVRVHLVGWEPAWDAFVSRDRLRTR